MSTPSALPRIAILLSLCVVVALGLPGCGLAAEYKILCRYDGDCISGFHCDEGTCLRAGQLRFPSLDAADVQWSLEKSGQSWILYTYAGSAYVLLDVRDSRRGPTLAQYSGTRQSLTAVAYRLQTSCRNGCVLGPSLDLDCTLVQPKPQLVCGSLLFERLRAADLATLR